MPNAFSNALGGGTDRLLLPGWILSGGTIGHQIDLRDHLVAMARRNASDVEAVEQAIGDGVYEYGSNAYTTAVLDDGMLPVLLAINLRDHHPSVTVEQAAALVSDHNRDALRRHLRRAWGYKPRLAVEPEDEGTGEPANWRRIVAFLRRSRRLSYEQIRALSPDQLANELMARPEEPTKEEQAIAKAKRAKMQRQGELRSFSRLDSIATERGVTPLELCKLDIEKVYEWVLERRDTNKPPPKIETTAAVLEKYRKHHGVD